VVKAATAPQRVVAKWRLIAVVLNGGPRCVVAVFGVVVFAAFIDVRNTGDRNK